VVTRELPHDADAERALIGCALLSEAAAENTQAVVVPEDFLSADHQHIWHAIGQTMSAHERVDRLTVSERLHGLVNDPMMTLATLENAVPSVSNAMRYARRVADLAARRRLIAAAAAITADAYDNEAADALERAHEHVDRIHLPTVTGAPSPHLGELEDAPYDWLIPGLLERGDRLLITAGEGVGKSTLLRQMAITCASGIHPFDLDRRVQPMNVLYVDFENSERVVRRSLNWLAKFSKSLEVERIRIEVRQGGLDVTSRHDRHWLMERVRANRPDVLFIGPVYRMGGESNAKTDGPGGESAAFRVTKALDAIRDMGVTLIMETHAPHGNGMGRDMRPFGSSLWLRWPEFGFGLRRDPDVDNKFEWSAFRGPRDDNREWPEALYRGAQGCWPWTPVAAGSAAPRKRRAS
jgi:hypothetical protein